MQKLFLAGSKHGNDVFSSHLLETLAALTKCSQPFEFREIDETSPLPEEIEVVIAPPDARVGTNSILYTRWNHSKIPEAIVQNINKAWHVVVPTEWHKQVFVDNGVVKPITVIRVGVNPQKPVPNPDKKFQFGFVGTLEDANFLFRCFKAAFGTLQKVVLLMVVTDGKFETYHSSVTVLDFPTSEFFATNNVFIELSCNEYWAKCSRASGRPVMAPHYGPLNEVRVPYGIPFRTTNVESNLSFVPHLVSDKLKNLFETLVDGPVTLVPDQFSWHENIGQVMDLIPGMIKSKLPVALFNPKNSPPGLIETTCIVQLGRFGDILNILPIAKHIFDRDGKKPVIMVSKDYASILSAVSYADPYVFDAPFTELSKAIVVAKAHFKNVLVSQMYGKGFSVIPKQPSFNTESWRAVGFLPMWNLLPLVLDVRDKTREKALMDRVIVKFDKPYVLLNFAGQSSPFPGEEIIADLRFRWSHMINFVDISNLKAEYLQDLLVLMENAAGMITIDTATLHMSSATRVRYVALITSGPTLWHGSTPKGNCVLQLRYNEVLERRQELHSFIESLEVQQYRQAYKVHHVWTDYPESKSDSARRQLAEASWKQCYETNSHWRSMPVLNEQLPRLFHDGKRALPYIKDVIEFAFSFMGDLDILVLSNSDICFSETFPKSIKNEMESRNCLYAFRRDFKSLTKLLAPEEVKAGHDYVGTDVFVFRRKWWRDNGATMPDMLLGAEGWDAVLRHLMHETESDCGIVRDQVYHERHDSTWERSENRYSLPSQIHNLKLAKGFFDARRIDPTQFGIR